MIRRSIALLVILASLIGTAIAQDVSDVDFSNINVDELSDQQIRRLWNRAQERGLSLNELEKMAVARGMEPSKVMKLRSRIRSLSSEDEGQRDIQTGQQRLRQWKGAKTDSTGGGIFSSLMGKQDTSRFPMRVDSAELKKQRLKEKIYGYDFFKKDVVTFEPSLNIPTPQNYQLGTGDELSIEIWGAAENTYRLSISPEGTIRINNLGPIYLNGLTIEDATKKLKQKLSEIYSGLRPQEGQQQTVFAEVSLVNVRSIKVNILGEISVPGTYTLPSLATVFNALYAAGGPNINGSFRKIKVIRNNKLEATFDLYNYLVVGDQSGNIRLQDQDIIKVESYQNRIEIKGEVKNTGFFELEDQETLQQLLDYAGGFSEKAYKKRIKIERITDVERSIIDVRKNNFDTFEMRNGDIVTVDSVLNRYVNRIEIRGAVYKPGEYELNDTTTLYSLIQRAEGLRGDAFTNRGIIYRSKPNLETESIAFDVAEVIEHPEEHDIALKRDDIIRISSIFDLREEYFVQINGSVQSTGKFPFAYGMTLEDLIFQANGFLEEAAPYNIEVARRIQGDTLAPTSDNIAKIYHFRVDESLTLSPKASQFTLQPFDRVYIRSAPGYQVQQEVKITGEVLYPGTYTLKNQSERISSLVERAGGLTDEAYPTGATLARTQEDMGNIGISLPDILEEPGSKYDLLLEQGDSLHIPKELQTVRVEGAVLFPISSRYERSRNFRDYISSAGGFSDLALEKKTYIVYANGEVDRTKSFLLFRNYPKVRPGARIVVPTKADRRELSPQERVSILSAIISMSAIVATTINQLTR